MKACTGYIQGTRLRFNQLVCLVIALALATSACSASEPGAITPTEPAIVTSPLPTNTPTATVTPSPEPTLTSTPTITPSPTLTPTATLTPEPLPVFASRELRFGAEPQTYIKDACIYLARRWAPGSSSPGTVVVPVMFHGILKPGHEVTDPKDITEEDFYSYMAYADRLGFKTITTEQLLGFLENNDPIPQRSMILILDDRRPGVITNQFMSVLEKYDWTLTLAYIADPNSMTWAMDQVKQEYKSGRLDVQSHGFTGELYITKDSDEEAVHKEIEGSTTALEQNFGKRPIAFIWPGGNFTSFAIDVARKDGYQLGFTAFSRGPILFNWVPLGEKERLMNDPLMVLPRAWSNSIPVNLDIAVRVSEQMAADAEQRYPDEAQYFRTYCGGELPER